MEPKTNFNQNKNETTPLSKQVPLNIRFVSNNDKENVSNEVLLVQEDRNGHTEFQSPNEFNIRISSTSSRSDQSINPFEVSIEKMSKNLLPFLLDNISPSIQNVSRSLKKTDSVSTFQSEVSDSSLRIIQNKNNGYKISEEDQGRVLQDITHCFKSDSDSQSVLSRNSFTQPLNTDMFNRSISHDHDGDEGSLTGSCNSMKLNMSSKENLQNRTSLITPMRYKKNKPKAHKTIFGNRNKNTLKFR